MTLARMVQRRGDAAVLASLNPVLLDGELGLTKDTKKMKIGDGTTPWNDLDYINGAAAAGVLNPPAADGESNFSKTVGALDSVDAARVTMSQGELARGALLVDANGTISVVIDVSDGLAQTVTVTGGLGNTATVLQADETRFIVSHVDIGAPGSGYAVDDAVTVTSGGETAIPMTVSAVNGDGGIEALSFDGSVVYETGNPAGAALAVTGGSGEGAEVNIVTRYAEGVQVVEGHLKYVPDADPLVQASRLRAYIAQALLSRFPVGPDDIADGAVTADKIAGDAIYGGKNVSVRKTELGIEISFIDSNTVSMVLTIVDQDDEPIPEVIVFISQTGSQSMTPVKTSAEGQCTLGTVTKNTLYDVQVRDRSPFALHPLEWENFYLDSNNISLSMDDMAQQVATDENGTPTPPTLKYMKYPNYASLRRWNGLKAMIDDHAEITYSGSGVSTFGSASGYWSGVLAPNGKIYAMPVSAGAILEIDPVARTVTTFGDLGGGDKWMSGVLAPNGHIIGVPYGAGNILDIDPIARTFSTFGSGLGSYRGAAVAPNGHIIGVPYGAGNILDIDPIARAFSMFGSGFSSYSGAVLAPNGHVIGIPYGATVVLDIDPIARSFETYGSMGGHDKWDSGVLVPNGKIYGMLYGLGPHMVIDPAGKTGTLIGGNMGGLHWIGGVLAPNGHAFGIPYGAGAILDIDPAGLTPTFTTFGSANGYTGGVLAPNGHIIGIPFTAGSVLDIAPDGGDLDLPVDLLISAWDNKF